MDPQPIKRRATPAFRVKPHSRETTHGKLRGLKCFSDVHDRVFQGWPISDLARYIQDDRQEYTDVTRDALIQVLKSYRSSIPPAQLIQKRMPQTFAKAAEKVDEGLDELDELGKLYKLQMERIEIDRGTEKKIHKLLGNMSQEVRVAAEILGRYATLKQDLGLARRNLGTLNIEAQVNAKIEGQYGNPSIVAVISNPVSRRKILGIAERLASLTTRTASNTHDADEGDGEGQTIDLEAGEGGEFELPSSLDEIDEESLPEYANAFAPKSAEGVPEEPPVEEPE